MLSQMPIFGHLHPKNVIFTQEKVIIAQKKVIFTKESYLNAIEMLQRLQFVTNYYFGLWKFSTSQKELLLVSNGSISFLISGGDSGESWVLVRALGLL